MQTALSTEPLRSLITTVALVHQLRGCLEDGRTKPQAKLL